MTGSAKSSPTSGRLPDNLLACAKFGCPHETFLGSAGCCIQHTTCIQQPADLSLIIYSIIQRCTTSMLWCAPVYMSGFGRHRGHAFAGALLGKAAPRLGMSSKQIELVQLGCKKALEKGKSTTSGTSLLGLNQDLSCKILQGRSKALHAQAAAQPQVASAAAHATGASRDHGQVFDSLWHPTDCEMAYLSLVDRNRVVHT